MKRSAFLFCFVMVAPATIASYNLADTKPFQTYKRNEVFPIETLPKEHQEEAKEMLQKMFESEALMTLVGDLKPMSSGSWMTLRIDVSDAPAKRIEDLLKIASVLRVGNDIETVFAPFTRVYEGKRFIEGFVFRRSNFRKVVTQYPKEFGYFGITPSMPFASTLGLIDGETTPERSRAYGLLFGYPKHAVDFFVEAETKQRETKEFVKRDFWTVPVYADKSNRFVYAIPKDAKPNEIDLKIKDHVTKVVAEFTKRRAKYDKNGKVDILNLARDWYKGPKGTYSPEFAQF
jgi:hypothetical protein